ncbi:hypothetical protein I7I53_08367 [Histoplasma capsulatum var. duboisii H88]|uniref:Uncharacterized protein n=1 Tax=Ajellomyces capsulatus (strain H88) TaxID=544711 RepID=A0A8A1LFK9_AJEC8|nr:hypothetical protein I7I53_08367 [Histoplasma capsulatum var. duboisii H88]
MSLLARAMEGAWANQTAFCGFYCRDPGHQQQSIVASAGESISGARHDIWRTLCSISLLRFRSLSFHRLLSPMSRYASL